MIPLPRFSALLLSLVIGLLAAPGLQAEPAASAATFMVVRVEARDVLNIRAAPNPSAAKVGEIPPDGRGVTPTGRTARHGNFTWREIAYGGVTGWVNGHFLAPEERPAADERRAAAPPPPPETTASIGEDKGPRPLEALSCAGTEPFWGMLLKGKETVFDSLGSGPVRLRLNPARHSPQLTTAWAIDATETETGQPVTITVRKTGQCSDGMSDIVFPYETLVNMRGGTLYAGCCSTAPSE